MPSKPKSEGDLPATVPGPKPGDFALGSVESRAAARAILHRLAENDGPQPEDIFIDLSFLTPQRVGEIWQLLRSLGPDSERGRVPGEPKIWLKWPEGFNPKLVQESTPPLTFQNASEDLVTDVLRVSNDAFRKAKQEGKKLPTFLNRL